MLATCSAAEFDRISKLPFAVRAFAFERLRPKTGMQTVKRALAPFALLLLRSVGGS